MTPGTALTTTTSSGSQNTVSDSNLQSSVAANGISGGTPATIQPGTNTNVLMSTGGIPLNGGSLSTVAIGQGAAQSSTAAPVQHHKINPALLGFSIGLFVLAVVVFWLMSRAEKKTTI